MRSVCSAKDASLEGESGVQGELLITHNAERITHQANASRLVARGATTSAREAEATSGETDGDHRARPHILGTNITCAFGVPGNMIHGVPSAGFAESPVEVSVAPGM